MLPISETDFFQDTHFLQSITASIQEGVIVLNKEGKIVSFNEQAKSILQRSGDELRDKLPLANTWTAIALDGSLIEGKDLPVAITMRTGKPQNNCLLGVAASDRPLIWLSVNSRMIKTSRDEVFVFATFIEVTKLINTNQSLQEEQEKLKESEEKFSQSFEYSSIGMAIVDPSGPILDTNTSFANMLGYTREELAKKTFQDITHADDLEMDLALVHQILNKEIKTYQLEKRYLHKDGHSIWASLNVSLVWSSNDEPKFFVAQIHEITEVKKLNKWLEDRNVELLKTQAALKRKIGQLKDFAGIITHDVRGPAGNIKRMLELYETSPEQETRNTAFNYLKKISHDLNNNLNELIHVLQIHLEKDIPYSECNFASITESVCLQLQNVITQKAAQITTDFQVEMISYPKIYLHSILYNLISNSLKYTREEVAPVILIRTYTKDDSTYLSVSDNGLGIDLKKYGKLLFKFQKSFHAGFDSKGIGLYLIRNQVEDLGGSISAESEENNGSTFTVKF